MPVRRLPPAAAPPRRHVAGLPPFHQHSQPPTLAHGIIRRPRILRVLPPAAHTPLPLARCLQPQQHPAARRVISACRCLLPTTHSALRIHIHSAFLWPLSRSLHAPARSSRHETPSRALDGSSARWLLSLSSHMWKEPSPDPTAPARSRPPPHAADGAAAPLCCPHSRQPQMPVPRGCLTAAALARSCIHSWVSADTGGGNADGRLSGGSISGVRRRVARLARWTDPHRVGCSPLAATWWGEI